MNLPDFSRLNGFVAHINKLPLPNRIFGYFVLVIGGSVGLVSLAFCAIMLWSLITIILDGSLFNNPPADEWDIR